LCFSVVAAGDRFLPARWLAPYTTF
jgi:hypothetical protein